MLHSKQKKRELNALFFQGIEITQYLSPTNQKLITTSVYLSRVSIPPVTTIIILILK